jgi:SAM-dependent methyltransferase
MSNAELTRARFAEFYFLYASDFERDVPMYLELSAKYTGPVLEVGCGTGRLAAHLASAGHEVVAIDTAREQLRTARRYLEPWSHRIVLQDFDLRSHPIPQRFHAAFVTLYCFNQLIDIEEQRLFLRHLRQCVKEPGVVALDLFCPLSRVRPELAGVWRELERVCEGQRLVMRDRRDMLTPLLERRTLRFQHGESQGEVVTHRRYVPLQHLERLLVEAGFENPRWVRDYDLATAQPVLEEAQPTGPFVLLADG